MKIKKLFWLILFLLIVQIAYSSSPDPTFTTPFEIQPFGVMDCNNYNSLYLNVSQNGNTIKIYETGNTANNLVLDSCFEDATYANFKFKIPAGGPYLPHGHYDIEYYAANIVGVETIPHKIRSFDVDNFGTSTIDLLEPTCILGTPKRCILNSTVLTSVKLNTTPWVANCKYSFDALSYQNFDVTDAMIHDLTGSFSIPSDKELTLFVNCSEIYFNESVLENYNFSDYYRLTLEDPVCNDLLYCGPITSQKIKITTNVNSQCGYDSNNDLSPPDEYIDMTPMQTSDGFSHTSATITILDNGYTAFYVTCVDPVSKENVSSKFIFYGQTFDAFDNDNSTADCGKLSGYTSICNSENQIKCWNNDIRSSPIEDKSCCGDDTDECWLDDRDNGCCDNDLAGGTTYIQDADISSKLCGLLGIKYNNGNNAALCDNDDETFCWAGTSLIDKSKGRSCCGDDTDETWSYTTNQKLSDILVESTCYKEEWKERASAHLTYYYISLE